MSATSITTQGSDDEGIDHRDDTILKTLAPDAYGPYGFDSHRANLLVRGMFMSHGLNKALAKRVAEELTDRAAARFAKSLDILIPLPMKTKSPELSEGQSDGGMWTEEMDRALVRLHAQRVSFKNIANCFAGKEVKGCQEHYYRLMKSEKWKRLHSELREAHDAL